MGRLILRADMAMLKVQQQLNSLESPRSSLGRKVFCEMSYSKSSMEQRRSLGLRLTQTGGVCVELDIFLIYPFHTVTMLLLHTCIRKP